jgi:hypothetical protein
MPCLKPFFFTVFAFFLFTAAVRAQEKALLNGTIIIMLTSNDTIWVGADSRTSALTDTGYSINKKGMCKIYSTNDIVYAMAGHVRYVDNSFDFIRLMQQSINEQKDFEKSMQQFQLRAKIEILSILRKFSTKSINTLIKTNNGSFLTVVAVSFVGGEKRMKEMRFAIQTGKEKNAWKVDYNEMSDDGVGTLRFFGHASNALAFVRDNNLYFGNGRDIPNKISDLIELESVKGTTTVGMPADVISIYNGGYKRVINSGLCQ